MVSIGFVFFSAPPDLAMTQFTVEGVSIILMLLALNFLRNTTPWKARFSFRVRDAKGSTIAGGLASFAWPINYLLRDADRRQRILGLSSGNSYKGGGGTQCV